jgi:uncharacterized membrane protein YqaE (UPF0057 family)
MKILAVVLLLSPLAVFAQVDVEQSAALLKPVLEMLLGFLPESVVAGLALMGAFRAVFKPLMLLLETIAVFTPNKKDDQLFKEVNEGNTYKSVRFFFDYIASIKIK